MNYKIAAVLIMFPLSPVYTCDFSSLLRLFCDKMGVEPNWRIYRTTIARAQKPVKNRMYKRGLTAVDLMVLIDSKKNRHKLTLSQGVVHMLLQR